MELLKQQIRTLRRLCKRWLSRTRTGMRCSHLLCMGTVHLFVLQQGQLPFLWFMVWKPSLRVLMETKLFEAEWCHSRFDQFNLIEEKRMPALCHGQLYQKRMKKAFDKKVRPHIFREGDLVLKRILPFTSDSRGKWTPNFEGPYVV